MYFDIKGLRIGFALTGSFCTIEDSLKILEELKKEDLDITAIVSENVSKLNTRFTIASELLAKLEKLTGKNVFVSIKDSEKIGSQGLLAALIIAPCTGNSIAKIANAITDTTVTMATKAMLRNNKPVIIALSTNDGLGINLENIGKLLNSKNIYIVPFFQDNHVNKPKSITSDLGLIIPTLKAALESEQLQPILTIKLPKTDIKNNNLYK